MFGLFSNNKTIKTEFRGLEVVLTQNNKDVSVTYLSQKIVLGNQSVDDIATVLLENCKIIFDALDYNNKKGQCAVQDVVLEQLSLLLSAYFTWGNNAWNMRYRNKKPLVVSEQDIVSSDGFSHTVRFLKKQSLPNWQSLLACLLDISQEEVDKRLVMLNNFNNK